MRTITPQYELLLSKLLHGISDTDTFDSVNIEFRSATSVFYKAVADASGRDEATIAAECIMFLPNGEHGTTNTVSKGDDSVVESPV